jgi:hypothetical protein
VSELLASMEREAVEAAADGKFGPLGTLIVNPLFKGHGRRSRPTDAGADRGEAERNVQAREARPAEANLI